MGTAAHGMDTAGHHEATKAPEATKATKEKKGQRKQNGA
jgi:hypothetical protein